MKNISHRRSWRSGTVQIHVDPPPTPLIKIKLDLKTEEYYVKIKLCRNPTSEKLDTCELKMALCENGEPEVFLLFA